MASATAPSWSLARLAHATGRDSLCHHLVWGQSLQWGSELLIISSTTSGVGIILNISTFLGRSCSCTSYTLYQSLPCHTWDYESCPGAATLHSLHLNLGVSAEVYSTAQFAPMMAIPGNPGSVAKAPRGCCVQPDGDDACPSAVDSVGDGYGMAVRFSFANGLEMM